MHILDPNDHHAKLVKHTRLCFVIVAYVTTKYAVRHCAGASFALDDPATDGGRCWSDRRKTYKERLRG